MGITDKYNTKAAALYRDKILTEATGNEWSEAASPANSYLPPVQSNLNRSSTSPSSGKKNTSMGAINSMDDLEGFLGKSKSEISQEKEDYFQKKLNENQHKRDDVPPSQGGKYVGFGSSPMPSQSNSAAAGGWDLSSLQDGWSMFSLGAQQLACTASEKAVKLGSKLNDNVIKPTAYKAQEIGTNVSKKAADGTLSRDVNSSIKGAAGKVSDYGVKGWYNLQSYLGYETKAIENSPVSSSHNNMQQPDASTHVTNGENLASHNVGSEANNDWNNDGWGNDENTKVGHQNGSADDCNDTKVPAKKVDKTNGWNDDWGSSESTAKSVKAPVAAGNGWDDDWKDTSFKKKSAKKDSFGADELENWLNDDTTSSKSK